MELIPAALFLALALLLLAAQVNEWRKLRRAQRRLRRECRDMEAAFVQSCKGTQRKAEDVRALVGEFRC